MQSQASRPQTVERRSEDGCLVLKLTVKDGKCVVERVHMDVRETTTRIMMSRDAECLRASLHDDRLHRTYPFMFVWAERQLDDQHLQRRLL